MSAVWHETIVDEIGEACWELYHENSKNERRAQSLPDPGKAVRHAAREPDFSALPAFGLGNANSIDTPFGATLLAQAEPMGAGRMPLGVLAALMTYGGANDPGPVDLYFAATSVADLPAGLYRYEPVRKTVQLLRRGDFSHRIAAMARDPEIILKSAVQLFAVGVFTRATIGDGERGYRRTLIAAGALMRGLRLVAAVLGHGHAEVDFFDREVDALFALDGLSSSVLHMVAVGATTR